MNMVFWFLWHIYSGPELGALQYNKPRSRTKSYHHKDSKDSDVYKVADWLF